MKIRILFLSFLLSSSAFINNFIPIQKRPSIKSSILRTSFNTSTTYKIKFDVINNNLTSNYSRSIAKRNVTIYKIKFDDFNNDFDNDLTLVKLYFYSVSIVYLFNFIINHIK
jgi:hypothetical protein